MVVTLVSASPWLKSRMWLDRSREDQCLDSLSEFRMASRIDDGIGTGVEEAEESEDAIEAAVPV